MQSRGGLELAAPPIADDILNDGAALPGRAARWRRFECPALAAADAGLALDPLPATGDVRYTSRDAWRRRLLAAADVLGLTVAYLGMWLIAPPPDGALLERLPLLGMLGVWVAINKILGLYDRDDKVIHRSTLDELPKIAHSITL